MATVCQRVDETDLGGSVVVGQGITADGAGASQSRSVGIVSLSGGGLLHGFYHNLFLLTKVIEGVCAFTVNNQDVRMKRFDEWRLGHG